MKIETKALEALLNGNHILKGIDVEIGDRELVGVIGPNGSGKSTILDAMTYLLTGNTQFNKARRTEIGQLRHMYAEIRKATERTAI